MIVFSIQKLQVQYDEYEVPNMGHSVSVEGRNVVGVKPGDIVDLDGRGLVVSEVQKRDDSRVRLMVSPMEKINDIKK